MKHMSTNGFTLLELLIVVAIIGILSAITVDYVGRSRGEGADAGVQRNLVNARTQAAVFFDNNGTFEGVCNNTTTGIFRHMRAAAQAQGITLRASYTDAQVGDAANDACHDSATAFAAWVPLKTGGGLCIDSNNTARVGTGGLPANQFTCP
jgi:prepilin-type N-terminal cleavage/methylation domain-containing protein